MVELVECRNYKFEDSSGKAHRSRHHHNPIPSAHGDARAGGYDSVAQRSNSNTPVAWQIGGGSYCCFPLNTTLLPPTTCGNPSRSKSTRCHVVRRKHVRKWTPISGWRQARKLLICTRYDRTRKKRKLARKTTLFWTIKVHTSQLVLRSENVRFQFSKTLRKRWPECVDKYHGKRCTQI